MIWWVSLAWGGDGGVLWDAEPSRRGRPVLVVVTPGFDLEGFLPLVQALGDDGHDVQVVQLPCADQSSSDLASMIAEASWAISEPPIVVAHGFGGTLALMAAPRSHASRMVLLAPVLDLVPVAATAWLVGLDLAHGVDLSAPLSWEGQDVASLLLGADPPALGCAPGPFLSEVAGWVQTGDVPIPLEQVALPVWIAVSLGDNVASVEGVVPTARRLPDRDLVRLGLNRFDPSDYTHGDMLRGDVPIRSAVKACR
jgi:pimeloyl-ACP methyl ester carboxylesterase